MCELSQRECNNCVQDVQSIHIPMYRFIHEFSKPQISLTESKYHHEVLVSFDSEVLNLDASVGFEDEVFNIDRLILILSVYSMLHIPCFNFVQVLFCFVFSLSFLWALSLL